MRSVVKYPESFWYEVFFHVILLEANLVYLAVVECCHTFSLHSFKSLVKVRSPPAAHIRRASELVNLHQVESEFPHTFFLTLF